MTAMSLLQDQAVVLARVDYSETSQVIAFFTRTHGKVRAIAKGVKRGTKRRFAAGLDLLEIGEVVVSAREGQSGLATLSEWKQSRGLLGLREKLFRIHAGLYVAELAHRLTEDADPHPMLFDALVGALKDLNEATEPLCAIVTYQRSLLEAIGSLPRFEACVTCDRVDDLTHFSSHEGGMVCRHCEPNHVEKREVAGTVLRRLRCDELPVGDAASQAGAVRQDQSLVGSFDLLDYHLSHLMGRRAETSEKIVPLLRRSVIKSQPAEQ